MKTFPFIVVFFILFSSAAKAQESDAALWATLSLEKQLSRKISISLDEEVRLKDNLSNPDLFYTNLGGLYKINKNLRAGLTYRLTEKKQENNMFSIRHRLMADVIYRKKFYGYLFQYRSRIQPELKDFSASETGRIPSWDWRHKAELKYDYDRFVPYAGTEWFLQLKDPENPERNRMMRQYRIFAGTDYKINSNHTLGFYGLLDKELNTSNPLTTWVLGLQYAYQF